MKKYTADGPNYNRGTAKDKRRRKLRWGRHNQHHLYECDPYVPTKRTLKKIDRGSRRQRFKL